MGGKGSGGKRENAAILPTSDRALNLQPGDNSRFIKNGMRLMKLPTVDLDDFDAVQNRIDEYFQIMFEDDMKPTVNGLAMALGIDRKGLWAIVNNQPYDGKGGVRKLKPEIHNLLKKSHDFMALLWEDYMQNRKIDTVAGIFLGKNHFGYKDQQEVVLTPNAPLGSDVASEEIEKKYLESVVVDSEDEK